MESVMKGVNMVRYCFGCGHIGDVGSEARDCCPDWSHAVMIPDQVAKQAALGFQVSVVGLPDACEALVNLVEGFPPFDFRSERYGSRLKDCHEWMAFYISTEEMKSRGWRNV